VGEGPWNSDQGVDSCAEWTGERPLGASGAVGCRAGAGRALRGRVEGAAVLARHFAVVRDEVWSGPAEEAVAGEWREAL
jgi:hypothetical protein